MAQPAVKTSFASGEWAPKLRSRVDVQKYHSGAALLRNFYVDYSGGGASTRQGTKFINQCKSSGSRLVGFQPSTTVSYILEFGQNYIRFYSNGAPILENVVTGGTGASSNTFTIANSYNVGDWVYATAWGGMTNVNGNYYIVASGTSSSQVVVTDLNGNAVVFTGTYTSGGQLQRVYTLVSPYNASDLFPNQSTGNPGIKYVQDATSLIICHPSYQPQILTINSATSWTLAAINFGPTIGTPTNLAVSSTDTAGTVWYYGYLVTAVDSNGQESATPSPVVYAGTNYIGTTQLSNTISWNAVSGAQSYNVYKASPSYKTTTPTGAQYGFIANVTGTSYLDSYPGISPDFAQTPPVSENPFLGSPIASYTVSGNGIYTTVPTVTIGSPSSGGVQATALAVLQVISATVSIGGVNCTVGDLLIPTASTYGGLTLMVTAVNGTGQPTSVSVVYGGSITSGAVPSNPVTFTPEGLGQNSSINLVWGVGQVQSINQGAGYASVPSVTLSGQTSATFSSGSYNSGTGVVTLIATASQSWTPGDNITVSAATGTGSFAMINGTFIAGAGTTGTTVTYTIATGLTMTISGATMTWGAGVTPVLGTGTAGNPGSPGFLQERLWLANQPKAVQTVNISQPGSFFNFNVSDPVQDDDAIQASIIAEELNDIRWLLPVPTGMIAGTGKGAFLLNGGGGISTMNPITPANITAQPQAFNGTNDLRPLKVNFDVLYCTNKGNYVRDLSYNLYAQIFTGSDISVFSNHLFFGYTLVDWTWVEEPFKTLWAVRNDGMMLSLGYVKEQELIGWAHHDTNGQFKSVASVIETVNGNTVDAAYVIVQRLVNGNLVQYVERMADRYFTYGYEDAWSVDCGLQTQPNTSPTSTLTITGDGSTIGNSITLSDTVGTPFTATMATNSWIVRAGGGRYTITAYTSSSQVTATVTRVPSVINEYTNTPFPVAGYTIWQPVMVVTGLTQLIGQTVTGVADGAVVGGVVSATGTITLTTAATKVTLGLAFTPQLQTLPLDLGEPTVQGKRKKITALTLRVADTLGLEAGTTFANAVPMKDFTLGNVPTTSTGPASITDLVNGDGRIIIDQAWQTAGSYCIEQNLPYPATVLGAFPEIEVGDTR